jgi:hypothetical protein
MGIDVARDTRAPFQIHAFEFDGQRWRVWWWGNSGAWHNLKVEAPWRASRKRKKWFHLGWNGERLARSKESRILDEHHFELAQRLIDELRTIDWTHA